MAPSPPAPWPRAVLGDFQRDGAGAQKSEARTRKLALIHWPAGDAYIAKELPAPPGALGPAPAAKGSASAAGRPIPWGNGTDPLIPLRSHIRNHGASPPADSIRDTPSTSRRLGSCRRRLGQPAVASPAFRPAGAALGMARTARCRPAAAPRRRPCGGGNLLRVGSIRCSPADRTAPRMGPPGLPVRARSDAGAPGFSVRLACRNEWRRRISAASAFRAAQA